MINRSGRASSLATNLQARLQKLARLRGNRRAVFALKTAVGLLVLAAVARHVHATWLRLESKGGTLHVEPAWIALAVVLYVAGLAVFGVFFDRILRSSPTPVGIGPAVRAYVMSHLGKYVPGKALVVVMRVALVTPYGAGGATSAFATLYETLVMMAGGALIATVGFLIGPAPWWPPAVAACLSVPLVVVVHPRVFPRISALLSQPFKSLGPQVLPRFSGRLLAEGLACSAAGWILLGMSQVAVVRAISPAGVAPGLWPLVIAGVALATVGGFAVAVMPGGLGVREGILMATLEPALGMETAVIAALALRLAWVAGEIGAAAVLTFVRPRVPVPSVALSEVPAS